MEEKNHLQPECRVVPSCPGGTGGWPLGSGHRGKLKPTGREVLTESWDVFRYPTQGRREHSGKAGGRKSPCSFLHAYMAILLTKTNTMPGKEWNGEADLTSCSNTEEKPSEAKRV